jgi:uncharacterized protein (TIGR00251 family)
MASSDGVVVHTFVQPGAARTALSGVHGEALKIKIAAPPIDGRANEALRQFLADLVGVPRSRVAVISGASSRHKRVEIAGVSPEEAAQVLRPEA